MSLAIRNLQKSYGGQEALRGITFELKPGTVTGFLGPNGAGKSTTMKIIMGLLPADSGESFVCGLSSEHQGLALRKEVGYLPENNPIYGEMYVKEFLLFSGSLFGMKPQRLNQRIDELMQACGLLPEKDQRIEELSRGYRQRVGLAHALLHDPPVLILDEPTSGLDPNQLAEIRNLIRNLSKQKTVLFSTHILQEAEALCDKVIIIHQGLIVADDTLEALRSRYDGQSLEDTFRFLTNVPAS